MAVVFISPRQKQKTFFIGITVLFLLFLAFVSFAVFAVKPAPSQYVLVFNKPKVNIDMSVFNSQQFKDLQPFTQMQIQFTYTALTKANKQQSGFISAASQDEAIANLKNMNLTVTSIQQAQVGRTDPFVPYYQVTPAPAVAPKK